MLIKTPKNLKIFITKTESYFIIKFFNLKGVIKKKLNSKNLTIKLTENNDIFICGIKQLSALKQKIMNNKLLIYKLIIEQIILNMFKISKNRLILEGIGFKVWKKKNILKFKLGYSIPLYIKIPFGIKISLYKQRKIALSSLYAQYLNIFTEKLRHLRFPDAYKKKGVRIWGYPVKLKIGKKTR